LRLWLWPYDTKHNDTQHNDTQHNDTHHNDTQHSCYDQHYFKRRLCLECCNEALSMNEIQHNDKKLTASIALL